MRLRESVRGLVLDDRGWMLLVHVDRPGLQPARGVWVNPGGGVEPGETRLDALRRELREETGIEVTALGPEIWTKTAMFAMDGWDGQVDHIHLVQVPRVEPVPALSPEELRAEHVHEVRWWSPAELAASDATFAPRDLPRLYREVTTCGIPEAPVALTGF